MPAAANKLCRSLSWSWSFSMNTSVSTEYGYWVFIPLPLVVFVTQLPSRLNQSSKYLSFASVFNSDPKLPRLLVPPACSLLTLNLNIKLNKMWTKQTQKCYNLMDRRVEKVKNKRQGEESGALSSRCRQQSIWLTTRCRLTLQLVPAAGFCSRPASPVAYPS